jgi:hypothetical protein
VSRRGAWRRFEVAFTGPFLTGQPLQVTISDYERLQREIAAELNRSSPGWEGPAWRGVETYGSGGGYTELVPLVLLCRQDEALKRRLEELSESRPAAERAWLRETTGGWSWRLRELKIELYDFGVGVLSGAYDVTAPARMRAEEIRHRAESVARLLQDEAAVERSPVAAAYDMLARETAVLFAEAVARCAAEHRREPWLHPLLSALPPTTADGPGAAGALDGQWGRLLWLHPVFVLSGGEGASLRQLQRISAPFEQTFSERIEHWHGLFTPGIDSSAMVLHRNRPKEKTPPMRLTLLMWAYYGLFMEIDRGLLAMLSSDRWQSPGTLPQLEEEASQIFDVYMRVREARARLDSALTDLAGGQLSIWNAIADVQKFDELVASVEGKLETLQRIVERRVQEASAARARRTGKVLSGLTALTVVTVTVGLVGLFLGTRRDASGHVEWRVATVAVAFVLAAIIYREAQRQITRRRTG